MIAQLGTGLMGAGFTRAFLKRGESVQVWNRTADRAKPLEADGARAFADVRDAVRGANEIHITLKDDESVDAVLEQIARAIEPGAMIFDHTTTAPTPTAERYARLAKAGVAFAHVPMFMGPKNALESTGLMLVSGPQERYDRVRPLIEPITGKLIYVGEGDERAAAFKLFGNMMLVFIVSGLADIFTFAKSMGITPVDAQALFDSFKPTGAIDVRGKNMANGDFTAQWELTMARKDVRLMLEEAQLHGAHLNVLPAIADFFDRGISAGHGSQDVGAVAALA
jgi:3-hydroxyisobutyrate dehydrogenase